MGTFNMLSTRSNYLSVDELNLDIILVQQHWLWKFEADTIMGDLFPRYDYSIKCVAENNNLPNDVRLSERAGVAILWKNSLSHLVTAHSDGSERINVISLDCSPTPVYITNIFIRLHATTGSNRLQAQLR